MGRRVTPQGMQCVRSDYSGLWRNLSIALLGLWAAFPALGAKKPVPGTSCVTALSHREPSDIAPGVVSLESVTELPLLKVWTWHSTLSGLALLGIDDQNQLWLAFPARSVAQPIHQFPSNVEVTRLASSPESDSLLIAMNGTVYRYSMKENALHLQDGTGVSPGRKKGMLGSASPHPALWNVEQVLSTESEVKGLHFTSEGLLAIAGFKLTLLEPEDGVPMQEWNRLVLPGNGDSKSGKFSSYYTGLIQPLSSHPALGFANAVDSGSSPRYGAYSYLVDLTSGEKKTDEFSGFAQVNPAGLVLFGPVTKQVNAGSSDMYLQSDATLHRFDTVGNLLPVSDFSFKGRDVEMALHPLEKKLALADHGKLSILSIPNKGAPSTEIEKMFSRSIKRIEYAANGKVMVVDLAAHSGEPCTVFLDAKTLAEIPESAIHSPTQVLMPTLGVSPDSQWVYVRQSIGSTGVLPLPK
jgi:hypothetical protein